MILARRAAVLCIAWIVSTYLFRIGHEALGHLSCAKLFGGDVRGLWFHPGAAVSSYRLPLDASTVARIVTGASGIAVQLVTGLAAFYLARRLRSVSLFVYAVASITAATSYAALGLYYEWGDPVGVVANIAGRDASFWKTPLRERGWFVPYVAATALVTFGFAREYATRVRGSLREHVTVALLVVAGAVSFRQVEKVILPPWTEAMDSAEHGRRLAERRGHAHAAPESPPPLLPILLVAQAACAVVALRAAAKPHSQNPLVQSPLAHSLFRRQPAPAGAGSLHS